MLGLHQPGWARRVALVAIAAIAVVALDAVPAGAVFRAGAPPPAARLHARLVRGANTQLTLSGTGPGTSVTGYIANPGSGFDPTTGYPTVTPPPDFSPKSEGFAGVIYGTPVGGGATLSLYCIDINTDTFIGNGYALGTWDEANVPNVGYVARILDEYYPNTDQPSSLPEDERAAAVQAAIWFFSDSFVLATSDSLYSDVAAIADKVISQGPIETPPPPSLTITPSNLSGPTGSVLGPYTVDSSATTTVTSIGADMFSDAAATHPIAQGAVVPDGQHIWLKSTGASSAQIEATAVAAVPAGNVYLYDGGASLAQKLILSQSGTLTTIVDATADFEAPGSLVVTKTIAGTAAGKQGPVTIVTSCNGAALTPNFDIAAGATGNHSHTYSDIPAGSVCTVTETVDGSTSTVSVTVSGSGQQHTIPSGSSVTATITNTYSEVPGSLTVNKVIAGPAAGSQGAVTIEATCNGTFLGEWTITAGIGAGTYPHTWTGIPANSSCVVTETVNGSTTTVKVTTVGSPQTVTVGAGEVAQANITDTYDFVAGSLAVTKTIAGPAAGHQGQVTIKVSCGGTELIPELIVNAGSPAGDYSHTYTDIAAGSTCSAEEVSDGSTSDVAVVTTGDVGTPITVPGGGTATLHITNTYSDATGSLVVTKNIDGPAAGSQGEVRISVTCGGTALADFVIPAGTNGLSEQTYDDIPAGSTCTVDETVDGSSSSVSVTVVGGSQSTTITAGHQAELAIANTYDYRPGSLTVEKVVEGPGAGEQGQITITTTCVLDGTSTPLLPDLVVPANSPAGTYSKTYDDIPAGSECTAVARPDGSNTKVADVDGGDGTSVTVPPGGIATIHLTDTYATGELVVNKTIEGSAAGLQGEVVIHTVCNGTALSDFTVQANTPAGTYDHTYTGILAGSTCTVTETTNGSSSTVHVVTVGSPVAVTISSDGSATADISDTYTQVPGSLVVTKDITGAAAGAQGPVSIAVSCDDATIGTFDLAAGATGSQSKTFSGIQAGSNCEITETADGSSSTVDVTVTGDGQTVTIPAAGTANAAITDTYTFANGSLIVGKTIEGPGAGQQGEIVIAVSCDGNQLPDFVIPAGQAAGTYTHDYTGLPAGSVCSVIETADGSTGKVAVAKRGSGSEVTIPAGAEATADLADHFESGALIVNKTITGGAAGSQGEVRIGVSCNEAGVQTPQPDFVIPAGTPAGTVSMSYPNILAGSTCSLTETATGATETATATTVGSPQDVTISENGTATADVVNTYDYVPGALVVTKDIAGPAASQQGQVSIGVSCALDGAPTSLDPFVIPAGQPAGIVSHTYEDIPAGSSCTVEETQNGATSTVSVVTVGGNQTLAIPPRDEVVANITDTYYLAPPVPGQLTVTKTIAGPAAGQQGAITIGVSCNGTSLPDFVIPAGSPAGTVSRSYPDIAAGSTCTVTETGNGASAAVLAVTEGSPQTVDISANGTGVANVTDTYSNVPIPVGSFTVTKDITGPAAGQQGPITVTASCNGRALSPTLDIPAGASGLQSQTYSGLPAGSVCSATAGPDGGTTTVQVTVTGDGVPVSIPAGGAATAALTDSYTSVPGSLVVTKVIAGPAAGQQGKVTIQAVCNGSALSPELYVPAGAAAGTYSQTYDDIAAGSSCTVHERGDGSTSTVSVTITGAGQTVTVPADKVVAADVTDTYALATGSLTVSKTIAGPAAGEQGVVTIQAVCDGIALTPQFTVAAGTAAGTSSHKYDNIPAGSTCTVTENTDGSNGAVQVKVTGDGQHLTVVAGATASATITDKYHRAPSTLLVKKTIAGAAAGNQGPVTIHVVCGGSALTPDLVVPAGTAASTVSHTYTGIPGGSSCNVSETADGATSAVSVTTVGSSQKLTVPAGKVTEVAITDVYEMRPGNLTVTKTIAGPAAGRQAEINILADCGGDNIFGLHIPAGAPAGPVPEVFYDIPAGSRCKVFEVDDGHSDTINVVGVGGGQKVTVPAGGRATARLTDIFSAAEVVTTTTTTTTTTVPSTTTTTTVPSTTTTTSHVTTTTTTVPSTTTTTVPSTTTTTKPHVPPVNVITGHGFWGPGGPTGTQSAWAGLSLLAGGAWLVGLRLRRKKYRGRHVTPGTRR